MEGRDTTQFSHENRFRPEAVKRLHNTLICIATERRVETRGRDQMRGNDRTASETQKILNLLDTGKDLHEEDRGRECRQHEFWLQENCCIGDDVKHDYNFLSCQRIVQY